ncbi:hypothetical protein TELCIR_14105 [Teladorsagia circumcincta]|uniref:COP9 signalosome complex subunit 6 n=1 Tax=Teladorsagia circumcincta TaxID=45464 RepID=A0A2G9U209_TELCI|nr:hypothetical protein TELCIR_14105 [Teladorsagia circumcincta]
MRAQSRDKTAQKVFGAVLGKVDEGHVEMVNSFELRMFMLDGHCRFNEEFLRQRLSQYKEVFPELEAVGWYCTGQDDLEQDEILLQSLFAVAIDSPLLVKLNPTVDSQAKRKVPVKVYYSRETPLVSSGHELVEVDWTLISEQSERIGIDHIARLSQVSAFELVAGEHSLFANYVTKPGYMTRPTFFRYLFSLHCTYSQSVW